MQQIQKQSISVLTREQLIQGLCECFGHLSSDFDGLSREDILALVDPIDLELLKGYLGI